MYTIPTDYLILVLILILGVFYLTYTKRTKYKDLPGPFSFPIVGNVIQLLTCSYPHAQFSHWAEKYGPIYQFKVGLKTAIVVSDPKMIKELFNDAAADGRMTDNAVMYEFTKGPNGVINAEGSTWQEQRRFTLKTLKKLGIANRSSLESLIMDEVLAMKGWFHELEGTPISGNRIFNAPVVNSLWRIVTGERCEWEKKDKPIELLNGAATFFTAIKAMAKNGLLFAPFLRFLAPEKLGWNKFIKGVDTMFQFISDSIDHHKKSFDPDNLRDFIDHYLLEMESATNPNSSFYKQNGDVNLVAVVYDLFMGGSETTSSVLSYAMLFLSHHPKAQEKLQEEIDLQLGDREPSLSDRPQMPYTEAVISELLRLSSVLSFGVPHVFTADIDFRGYHIPKGAIVFANLYGVNNDPKIWTSPKSFMPERFLSEDGKHYKKRDELIAFSEGKRKCPGEGLARDSLFLFITYIFQHFTVNPEKTDAEEFPDFEPEPCYILNPKEFKIVMLSRK